MTRGGDKMKRGLRQCLDQERDTHQAEQLGAQDSRALWTYSIVTADVGQH